MIISYFCKQNLNTIYFCVGNEETTNTASNIACKRCIYSGGSKNSNRCCDRYEGRTALWRDDS